MSSDQANTTPNSKPKKPKDKEEIATQKFYTQEDITKLNNVVNEPTRSIEEIKTSFDEQMSNSSWEKSEPYYKDVLSIYYTETGIADSSETHFLEVKTDGNTYYSKNTAEDQLVLSLSEVLTRIEGKRHISYKKFEHAIINHEFKGMEKTNQIDDTGDSYLRIISRLGLGPYLIFHNKENKGLPFLLVSEGDGSVVKYNSLEEIETDINSIDQKTLKESSDSQKESKTDQGTIQKVPTPPESQQTREKFSA